MVACNTRGVSRTVILIGRWALKVPALHYGWKNFLWGLLANMQERQFGRCGWPELCPVTFSIPGGFLVIMPKVKVLTDDEFLRFDAVSFIAGPDHIMPVELKSDSFGYFDGRIVAIDYG